MTARIEKLTPAQIARFPEFVEKWTKIGLCTDPANRDAASEGIRLAYAAAKLKPPNRIIWCGSPLSQGITRAVVQKVLASTGRAFVGASVRDSVRASVRDNVGASVWDNVGDSVGDSVRASVGDSVGDSVRASVGASVWDSVGASVWDNVGASVGDNVRASVRDSVRDSVRASVRDNVGASVRDSVWDSVGDNVGDSVGDNVGASVRDSVWDSVGDNVGDSVGDSVRASGYGQHDANWLAFYEYFRLVCALEKQTDKLDGLFRLARNAGWYLPHANICWISERHDVVRLQGNRLHCENGPAVHYPDGWSIYALNGVRVPESLVMTPARDLDPKLILKEQNAEVRREIVRKIGIERVCEGLNAKVLDKLGEMYELLDLNLGDGRSRPYLKMRNPSVGVWHLEGVAPECRTVEQAINWRRYGDVSKKWQPTQLT